MFVIELSYKADLKQIDAHMGAHMKFVRKYYAAGNFLVSGRKIPRDGGIILAVGESREAIEAIVKEDPFYTKGLADVRVIEFRASQRADNIRERIGGANCSASGRDARPALLLVRAERSQPLDWLTPAAVRRVELCGQRAEDYTSSLDSLAPHLAGFSDRQAHRRAPTLTPPNVGL
jgi:uncharacterized protein YciI